MADKKIEKIKLEMLELWNGYPKGWVAEVPERTANNLLASGIAKRWAEKPAEPEPEPEPVTEPEPLAEPETAEVEVPTERAVRPSPRRRKRKE